MISDKAMEKEKGVTYSEEKRGENSPQGEDVAAKERAAREARRKRMAAIAAAEAKRRYFEYYDDVKHDRNKEW